MMRQRRSSEGSQVLTPHRRKPSRGKRISAFLDLLCDLCGETRHYLLHLEAGDIYVCPCCSSMRTSPITTPE